MAIKTLLLDEAEFIDFQLYGLVSAYADPAQMVYHINRSFETQFIRCADLDVVIENQITYFPVFEWENLETGTYYHIIKNASYSLNSTDNFGNLSTLFDVTPVLIQAYKQYNFLLKVSGDSSEELPFDENNFIQLISELETDGIKTINRLIF
ncbi:IPExxxVDY family protein [Moheibacter lacus]|uniref:IPExxxVDY family protein n=1 Tax=Moheibacter lacus TaxID=2745851 RepID=A0A838ZJV9_9FLAO|nr:IPExxxVDY family protein [Moheibacter lacus]MBA5628654.1 IPExxxVDY family protein [Moheibacter lacus]